MGQSISRKRPWLAALLGALLTGLGHFYLRRWRRAVGWIAVMVGVTVLFVDPASFDVADIGSLGGFLSAVPLVVVGVLSVVDAYLLAYVQNLAVQLRATPETVSTHCPNCGKTLDSDLEFCHWCTTYLDDVDRPDEQMDDELIQDKLN